MHGDFDPPSPVVYHVQLSEDYVATLTNYEYGLLHLIALPHKIFGGTTVAKAILKYFVDCEMISTNQTGWNITEKGNFIYNVLRTRGIIPFPPGWMYKESSWNNIVLLDECEELFLYHVDAWQELDQNPGC